MKRSPAVTVTTADPLTGAGFFGRLHVPEPVSHKGQNGKVLVIGGSSLFHSAVVWPAEVASHFADMVHISSIEENNEIIRQMKVKWRNGIVISQNDLADYIREDDAVLMGNGMMRTQEEFKPDAQKRSLSEVLRIENEGERAYYMTDYLLHAFPGKKWVLDAGALQMMAPQWLTDLKLPAIVTPHQREFEKLFGVKILDMEEGDKVNTVAAMAARYRVVILLKSAYDIVSDGERSFVIRGGNSGLTRGGTGDILAGIAASLYAKNSALDSAVVASVLIKAAAEDLARSMGIWYNNTDLIAQLPRVMNRFMGQYNKAYRAIT